MTGSALKEGVSEVHISQVETLKAFSTLQMEAAKSSETLESITLQGTTAGVCSPP
jgi:hypothetical protein